MSPYLKDTLPCKEQFKKSYCLHERWGFQRISHNGTEHQKQTNRETNHPAPKNEYQTCTLLSNSSWEGDAGSEAMERVKARCMVYTKANRHPFKHSTA
eukprot:scaffold316337_cov14-Tisochrysis_lutea.AAC.1